MEEEKIIKVNTDDFKIEELTLEEQEAFNYFNKSSAEATFETDIDGDKFLEALGINKENNFGKMQYKVTTLLNLIVKQQKQIKLLEEDVDGYRGLSKQIEEDYRYRLEHIGD